MLWIEFGLVTPTVAEAVSATANCLYFWRYARRTPSRARRVASTSLAFLSAALVLEALLFLSYGWLQARAYGAAALAATLLLRWTLLAVALLLSLLIWRSPLRRG